MNRTFYLLIKSESDIGIEFLFTEDDIIYFYGESSFKSFEEKEAFKIKKGTFQGCLSSFKNSKGYYSRCITLCSNNTEIIQKIVFENVYYAPIGSILFGTNQSFFTGIVTNGFDSFITFYKLCNDPFELIVTGIDDFNFLPF